MAKNSEDLPKAFVKVNLRTGEGLDFKKVPMDGVLKQAVSESHQEFRAAVGLLEVMQHEGRNEAAIFLLGLLAHSGDDWERRVEILERLHGFETRGFASFLLGELRRVKSNNTTRRYLDAVLKALARMPLELVEDGLLELISDTGFTPRMREKFREALDKATFRY